MIIPKTLLDSIKMKNKRVSDIDTMVNRFLAWELPKGFHPDAGISFTPRNRPYFWPIGTNLFTASQAKEMFEYCMKDLEKPITPYTDDLYKESIDTLRKQAEL